MSRRAWRAVLRAAVGLGLGAFLGVAADRPAAAQPTFPKPARYEPTAAEKAAIRAKVDDLAAALKALPPGLPRDLVDDVAVFHKAGDWLLRTGEFFDKKDVATAHQVLDRGLERARALTKRGPAPWAKGPGTVARGYRSKLDGSVQPYAVVVPDGLDLGSNARVRLDVVLHGRDQSLSEVRFLGRHDGKPAPKGPDAAGKLTLHVYGRGNNAYRWAGEADVFEAIEAVRRNYPVDDNRVVLRGFSMGGAGAWHLGLHHPSFWSSVEAGAGFTETRRYARLKDTPGYQEKGLHIYDAVDYALNAFDVPVAGYGGEDDPQLQASTNVVDALKALGFTLKTDGLVTKGEGIDFLRVVGAKMGHKVDPPSAKLLAGFHDARASVGADRKPARVRFATYTVKYPRAAWVRVERLVEHYKRAEVDAEIQGDRVVVAKAENVAVLALDRSAGSTAVVGGQELPLASAAKGLLPQVYYRKTDAGAWEVMGHDESRALEENLGRVKRPGVQGPIDDAFTGAFLVVKGTGTPWSPAVQAWADARLDRFRKEWAEFLRGDVPVKDDTAVTPEDVETRHLILFGDPGSNKVLARLLDRLPARWSRSEVSVGGASGPSRDHAAVLVAPNPEAPSHYVVVNSGPTFGRASFVGTNALLYPRLGDYALFQTVGPEGRVVTSGYFDEGWSLRAKGDGGR